MRHGSLFSGIGGFDLASEWMGWENIFHCEWNEFGKKVLHHYWPNAESFDDITKTDFTKYANKIDILTGGFPCQPYSQAGQRKGKEDERHLWPEMLRAIQEIKPKYIVGENVFGLLNWNGGMVFDEVHSDLESAGYEVQAVVIPAAAVNAPHGRDRVWFVAYSIDNRHNSERNEASEKNGISGKHREEMDTREFDGTIISRDVTNSKFASTGSDGGTNDETQGNIRRGNEGDVFGTLCSDGNASNTNSSGQQTFDNQKRFVGKKDRTKAFGGNSPKSVYTKQGWDNFPTQSPICGGDDGLPTELDGITFSKWRNESIKAYGNAIVPQVAYEIFKAIQATIQGVD
jgi:DNA (cytosine-5)-methyltransferase 1